MNLTEKNKERARLTLYIILLLILFIFGYQLGQKHTADNLKIYYSEKYKGCICSTYQINNTFILLDEQEIYQQQTNHNIQH